MTDDDQTVTPLTAGDRERMTAQRALCERHLTADARATYATVDGKLGLLRALVAGKVFGRDQTRELQGIAFVFGDAMALQAGLEWVIAADEHGREPALRVPGSSILLYPLTMIAKRLEAGETVDVRELFDGVIDQLDFVRATAPS